jgi:hypothetical protein
MVKFKFSPYMVMNYRPPYLNTSVDCLLCAADFDNETFTILLIEDTRHTVLKEPIVVSISTCTIPKMHRNHSKKITELKNNE